MLVQPYQNEIEDSNCKENLRIKQSMSIVDPFLTELNDEDDSFQWRPSKFDKYRFYEELESDEEESDC